jgi:membrane protein YqaA with SNARE-associated domain
MARKRAFMGEVGRYHQYYKRKGGYVFMRKNLWKLLIALAVIGVMAWAFDRYIFNISDGIKILQAKFPQWVVFAVFFVSEFTLGIIPPESLILWVNEFSYPWFWIFILSTISYAGGVFAYFIGTRLYLLPKIHRWVDETFREQFDQLRRFGGLLIVLATMTPLPFPPSCMVAGIIHFPRRTFLVLTLTRFIRFFLYGALLLSIF